MSTSNPVPKIYRAVIDDVIKNVREAFLNEGVDDQVLQELKQLWESKLLQSRAIDIMPSDVNVQVSLTYPHNMQQIQGMNRAQQQQQASSSQQQQPQVVQSTSGPYLQNHAGQVVYVSSHPTLPTLGVGPMSGAGAQAAIALQNATQQGGAIGIPQQIAGLHQAQVIRVQQGNTPTQQAQMFPGYQAGTRGGMITGPRVIFTQQQQGQHAHVKQSVIQVDGSSDNPQEEMQTELSCSCPSTSTSTSLLKTSAFNAREIKETKSFGRKKNRQKPAEIVLQLDGANGSDSDEFDDEEEEEDEDFDNYPVAAAIPSVAGTGDAEDEAAEEEEPLNSEDDVSDEDPTDLFDTDNVVVCQYDKIARVRNRWKFHLKDGIMNLRSKDYVFHKANGDSEW